MTWMPLCIVVCGEPLRGVLRRLGTSPGAASRVCPVPMNQGSDTRDAPPRRCARLSTGKRSFGRPAGLRVFDRLPCSRTSFCPEGLMVRISRPLPRNPAFLRFLHPRSQPICTPMMLSFAPLWQCHLGVNLSQKHAVVACRDFRTACCA